MAQWLKQSVATTAIAGPWVNIDGRTLVAPTLNTAAAVQVRKAGGNFANAGASSDLQFSAALTGYTNYLVSAALVDTLGPLRLHFAHSAVSAFPVWEDYEVVTSAAWDAYFRTTGGALPCDVVQWAHGSVAAIATAGTIPADLMYINHSVSAQAAFLRTNVMQVNTVSAGARLEVDILRVNGVSAQGRLQADVIFWSGASAAAITTAGTVPVDVMYVNHTGSAGNAGLLSVNVVQWSSAALAASNAGIPVVDVLTWQHTTAAAIATAGTVPADIMYINHSVSAEAGPLLVNVAEWASAAIAVGNAGIPVVDVLTWQHTTAASVATAGTIPADLMYIGHGVSASQALLPVNVVEWGSAGIASALISANVGSLAAGLLVSANVGQWFGTAVVAPVSGGWPSVAVASYLAGQAPLQPTVAGRTLDVSTGGEGGVDWANIGTPGSTQNLSATTVGVIGTGGIVAGSFAAGAIDAAALAADAVDEILDDTLEGTLTVRQALRIMLSALAGKLSGAGTTNVLIRDIGDTKNRIDATVDSVGNRSAVTRDGT